MLTALMVLLRSIGLICCGHRAIALENLALRQQLAVLKRTVASTPPLDRSTVLDPPGEGLAGLALRLDRRAASQIRWSDGTAVLPIWVLEK